LAHLARVAFILGRPETIDRSRACPPLLSRRFSSLLGPFFGPLRSSLIAFLLLVVANGTTVSYIGKSSKTAAHLLVEVSYVLAEKRSAASVISYTAH